MTTTAAPALPLRTVDQIIERINGLGNEDLFGFTWGALAEFVPFERLTELSGVEPDKLAALSDDEKATYAAPTRERVLDVMRTYMAFALGKAEDHRGLSAGRSVDKLRAWAWVLCDDDRFREGQQPYRNYGVPILKAMCEHYGFDFPQHGPLQAMAQGLPCRPDCNEGCSRR